MSTATAVPQTRGELEGDEALETLRQTGRRRLLIDSLHRFRAADGFSHSRALAFQATLTMLPALIAIVGLAAALSSGYHVFGTNQVGASVLVKGIRSQVDVAYETPMAIVNRHLAHVETVFLLPDPAHALVSSSLVRQVASLGGDVSPYVPGAVARFLDTGARGI